MSVYVPHLRRSVAWECDREDWPFVPFDNETEDDRARRLESLDYAHRYGQRWLELPRLDEDAYAEYHRVAYQNFLFDHAMLGWWDVARIDGGVGSGLNAIAKTRVFVRDQFRPDDTLAHVMHRAKLFESVGEARRNGWNKPIVTGLYTVGKNRQRVLVVDEEPPIPPRRDEVEIRIQFEGGLYDDFVFRLRDTGDWGCYCRRWTGETYEGYWRYFERCTRADAFAQTRHEIAYAVRWEPSGFHDRWKIAVIMPQISRLNPRSYDALAEQIERSRASMIGRAPHKIEKVFVTF